VIEWHTPSDPAVTVTHGTEGKYLIALSLDTFFWHIFNHKGEVVASGVGSSLPAAKQVIQTTMSSFIGRDRIKSGSYPPGVPSSGGKK